MINFKTNERVPKLMLIDDNPGEELILKSALKRIQIKNVALTAFQNPEKALEHIEKLLQTDEGKKELPDLILLDLNMPIMNGSELLVKLKNIEALRVIPIIIITTSSIEDELEKCYKLHANSVLQKAMDFDDYVHSLDLMTTFWFHHAARIAVK